MNVKNLKKIFLHIEDLKTVKRKGWVIRSKVKEVESVADHSYAATSIAMIISDLVGTNTEKVMKMMLIHDLPEGIIGDLVPGENANKDSDEEECMRPRRKRKKKPEKSACAKCHTLELQGFLESRHGMRLNQENLSPMKPGMARISMNADASEKELTCNSCHGAHQFDTRSAEVDSCLECHNDQHSITFKKSSHFKLWGSKEGTNKGGVSCANCHFPRKQVRTAGIERV